MRVGIITRHAITNYGSLLQTYALQEVLKELGHEAEIINYQREDEQYSNLANVYLKRTGFWKRNALTRTGYRLIQGPSYVIAGKHFEKEQEKYLDLSQERYTSLEQLRDNPPDYDVYCTGSDQVWGRIGEDEYDPAYYLDFVKNSDKCKKIAYAASFGKTELTPELLENAKETIADYDDVAVREKSAVEILNDLGIEDAKQVVDPTLLFTGDDWRKIAGEKPRKEDYVLTYQLHGNNAMPDYAKAYADKMGRPLLRLTPSMHHLRYKGGKVYLPEVKDFLAYLMHASYLITDSFHGTAFAINFNVDFVNVLHHKTGTRSTSILDALGLKDRILSDYDDFSHVGTHIDYERVNPLLEKNRRESRALLKGFLE